MDAIPRTAVNHAKQLSIDVIITDYHEVTENIEEALVINPNNKACTYPFKDLSSCGIVFKFCEAISIYYTMKCIYKYIDLVMLGTVSEEFSIKGENKTIVNIGIILF